MCAGSQAGNLKIWDLEAARLVRTHTGIYRLYLEIMSHGFIFWLRPTAPHPTPLCLISGLMLRQNIFYCSSN